MIRRWLTGALVASFPLLLSPPAVVAQDVGQPREKGVALIDVGLPGQPDIGKLGQRDAPVTVRAGRDRYREGRPMVARSSRPGRASSTAFLVGFIAAGAR